ncbi:MAG: hypothetical protein MZV70_10500 [Desulfobacterales bacterium]|nr:hypothetical protein [Desulfobacterales bacterium]
MYDDARALSGGPDQPQRGDVHGVDQEVPRGFPAHGQQPGGAPARPSTAWNRTIFAVDEAVIHDHGADKPRVRLIGDEKVFGYKPLAKNDATQIRIPFETEAAHALLKGAVQTRADREQRLPHPRRAALQRRPRRLRRVPLLGGGKRQGRHEAPHPARHAERLCSAVSRQLAVAKADAWKIVGFMVLSILILMAGIYLTLQRLVVKPVSRIAGGLDRSAEQVAAAAGQVASSSQVLASGTSEQAASIEETSSSLEEMASMTKQNADNARQADNLMKEARAGRRRGQRLDGRAEPVDAGRSRRPARRPPRSSRPSTRSPSRPTCWR